MSKLKVNVKCFPWQFLFYSYLYKIKGEIMSGMTGRNKQGEIFLII